MPHKPLVERIRGEYLEMPGLRLTLEQAQRLWGVEQALCQIVLDILVDEQFLCVNADGQYVRMTDGADHRRSPWVRAHLWPGARVLKAS